MRNETGPGGQSPALLSFRERSLQSRWHIPPGPPPLLEHSGQGESRLLMKQTQQLHLKDISSLIWVLNLNRSKLNPRGQTVQRVFAKRQTSLQEGLRIRTKQQLLDKQEV